MLRRTDAWLLVAVLALGACGKKEAIVQAEAMADAICKCKDFECALKARIDGTAKLVKFKDEKGSEDEAKQVASALARSEACQQKLKATSPAPAAPAPAGETK